MYVGAGLLALMDTEDELASVVGHEIEHIDNYHCVERVQQEQILKNIPLGELVSIPLIIFEAGYNKDQELEADLEGTKLAVASGYSEQGSIHMFQTFDAKFKEAQASARTPDQEVASVAFQTLEGYFRSHPLPTERIAQLQRQSWPQQAEQPLSIKQLVAQQTPQPVKTP